MKRITSVATLILALVLLASPAMSQIIPAGEDRWVTPADGTTKFGFPPGDVESLCGAPMSSFWNHTVELKGVPFPGEDWDTSVARLTDANVSFVSATSAVVAAVPIQVTRLEFESIDPQQTPCGMLNWRVTTFDHQPITQMEIKRTSNQGGVFRATISVRVLFEATDMAGNFVGHLFYTMDLPDNTGVPWSFDPMNGNFRPGIDTSENCIDVMRQKLQTATGDHVYFIEDMIAQGRCVGPQ